MANATRIEQDHHDPVITIANLNEDFPMVLVAGESGMDRPIRWVHISEHEDPAPWLSGGELVLTTGYNLTDAWKQRRFVEALAKEDAAGLGFGTGFDHAEIPEAMVETAQEIGFPLFLVPYSVPFIAISERASAQLVNDQYEALERGSRIQGQLQLLVIEGYPLETILGSVADAIAGSVFVLDRMGRITARRGEPSFPVDAVAAELVERSQQRRLTPFTPRDIGESSLAVPVPGSQGDLAAGWLLVIADGERTLGQFESLMTRLSSTVVGLGLMRMRTVRETERRLAGDLLSDALNGHSDPGEIAGRLESFGLDSSIAVLVFEAGASNTVEAAIEESLRKVPITTLVATTEITRTRLVCVIVDTTDADPVELAQTLYDEIDAGAGGHRAAVSRSVQARSLRRAFHEARCALEATSLGVDPPPIASHGDLGAFTLLLSVQDDEALRQFSAAVLDPIGADDDAHTTELLHSLEVFIECNGSWERAAKLLFCHRHTLRHRIDKVEELTGRDFHRASDRIECWLALQARQLVN
jgi:purine catabolism regulator